MTEFVVRVLAVALAVILITTFILRAMRSGRSRPASSIVVSGIENVGRGFILFTSDTCPTCVEARAVLDRILGPDGYTEHRWEDNADALAAAGIDEVPLTVVVGRGRRVRAVMRGVPHPNRVRAERIRTLL